jgi:uncharacterized protein with HEPN domain
MRNDRTYLTHIKEAIESIEAYLKDTDYNSFASNKMMVDAVVRELEIIGEASNSLSNEFREKYSEILWRRMKNMRNFLIHEYFGVNTKVVWETCKNDVPKLKKFVKTALNE